MAKDQICKHCNAVNSHPSFKCFHAPKAKIKTSKPLSPKSGYTIPKVSKHHEKDLNLYYKARREYLDENPKCQFPGCNQMKDLQIHHKKGRIGTLLYNKEFFLSVCDSHHKWIEANKSKAKELGLSLDRLTKN